jgi:hypothetical protein
MGEVMKRVYANGVGLNGAKGPLGFEFFNYGALCTLLKDCGDEREILGGNPIMLTAFEGSRGREAKEEIAKGGFRLINVDGMINDELCTIVGEIDVSKTPELVLAGASPSLFPTVCRAAKRGLRVVWVGTSSPRTFRNAGMDEEVLAQLMVDKISYIDLRDHRVKIAKGTIRETVPVGAVQADYTRAIVELRTQDGKKHRDLLDLITRAQNELGAKVTWEA